MHTLLPAACIRRESADSIQRSSAYRKESITRSEDNNVLTINLDIVLQENLKLASNQVATLTPFLEADGKTQILPSIIVYGRKRDIVSQRNHQTPENTYTILRRKQHQAQK